MGIKSNKILEFSRGLTEYDRLVSTYASALLKGLDPAPDNEKGYRLETLLYLNRPFSNLVKVKVTNGSLDKNYFIKRFRNKTSPGGFEKIRQRVLGEFNTLSYYFEKYQEEKVFKLPRPVACFPDQLILITEEIPGEMISKILERTSYFYPSPNTLKRLAEHCRLAGEWLTHFQWNSLKDGTVKMNRLEMVKYIDVRLARLEMLPNVNFSHHDRMTLLDQINFLMDRVRDQDLSTCGIHADFCPGNCIRTKDGLGVVDFAMYQPGSVFHDVSHFYHRLTILRHKPIYRRETIRFMAKKFMEGYSGPASFDSPLFLLFLIQHLICHCDMIAQQNPSHWLAKFYNRKILSTYAKQLKIWCKKIPQDPSCLFFYA